MVYFNKVNSEFVRKLFIYEYFNNSSAVGRMRRNKYLSLTGSKPDTVDHPRMWHLKSENEKFVANYLEHVAETHENDDVINFFPITQEQLKEIPKPGK